MAGIVYGNRIGKQGRIAIGCAAWVFDPVNQKALLIRRSDNKRWAVPGGYMEPGESVTEACEREVMEEAGIRVKATRLVAVYSNPHILLEYPDGNKWQLVVLHFEAEKVAGDIMSGDETTDVGYFSLEEIAEMDIGDFDRQRIADGFDFQGYTFVCDNFRI